MNRPRSTLVVLAGSFLIAGMVEPFAPKGTGPYSPGEVVHSVVIAVLTYIWCKQDANSRGTVPPNGAALLAGVFPPVGVPVYFLRTRAIRQAAVAIGKTLLFLVAAGVLLGVGLFFGDLLNDFLSKATK